MRYAVCGSLYGGFCIIGKPYSSKFVGLKIVNSKVVSSKIVNSKVVNSKIVKFRSV